MGVDRRCALTERIKYYLNEKSFFNLTPYCPTDRRATRLGRQTSPLLPHNGDYTDRSERKFVEILLVREGGGVEVKNAQNHEI